jgi:hypothetical protein
MRYELSWVGLSLIRQKEGTLIELGRHFSAFTESYIAFSPRLPSVDHLLFAGLALLTPVWAVLLLGVFVLLEFGWVVCFFVSGQNSQKRCCYVNDQ